MMKDAKSKYWSIVVVNPKHDEQDTLERRMKRVPFAIYGADWINDDDFIFEGLIVFPYKVPYHTAKKFYPKGNWMICEDVNEKLREIEIYEYSKMFGKLALQTIKKNLEQEMDAEANAH